MKLSLKSAILSRSSKSKVMQLIDSESKALNDENNTDKARSSEMGSKDNLDILKLRSSDSAKQNEQRS